MKVFIASSAELKHERSVLSACSLYLDRLLRERMPDLGMAFEPVMWEYLDSAMGMEHKQAEYNRELAKCDAVIVLFWRKFGIYTESEFLTALQSRRSVGVFHCLAVLFKETGATVSQELVSFRNALPTKYNIKPIVFHSDDELRDRFIDIIFEAMIDTHAGMLRPPDAVLAYYGLK